MCVKVIGKIKSKRSRPYGYYATVEIMFDKVGEYLSHTVRKTGLKWLDKVAEKVAKGMKDCRIVGDSDHITGGTGAAYYKYKVTFGDPIAYEMDIDENGKERRKGAE